MKQFRLLLKLIILALLVTACGDSTAGSLGLINATTATPTAQTTTNPTSTTPPATTSRPFQNSPTAAPTTPPTEGGKIVQAQVGTPFSLKLGQVAQVAPANIELSPQKVLEDSRCPTNVNCAWSGQLIVTVAVSKDGKALGSFSLNNIEAIRNKAKPTFENYNLALVDAMPRRVYENYGSSNAQIKSIKPEDYVLTFQLTQLEEGLAQPDNVALGQRVPLKYGQSALYPAEKLSLKFSAVTNDSRCPKSANVACYTSGQASIALEATKDGQTQTLTLTIPGLTDDTTDRPITNTSGYIGTFGGYRIQLIRLDPQPTLSDPARLNEPGRYTATLLVTKAS